MHRSTRSYAAFALAPLALLAAAQACGSTDDGSTTSSTFGTGGAASSTSTSTNNGGSGVGGDILPSAVASSSSTGTGTTGAGTGGQGGGDTCVGDPNGGAHVWSKVGGNDAGQYGLGVAVDTAGNVVVAGAFGGTLTFGNITLTSAGSDDVFVAKFGPDGAPLWAKSFGDGGKNQSAYSVAVDSMGNILLAGTFLGSLSFGGATFTSGGCCFADAFVARLDPQGNHLWSKSFGDTNNQATFAVAAGPAGEVVVAGQYQINMTIDGVALPGANAYDAFVALFGPQGDVKWAKTFGGPEDQAARAVAFDASGNVLITGLTKGAITLPDGSSLPLQGTSDAFVAKLQPSGALAWGKLFGNGKSSGEGVAAAPNGDVLVTGDRTGPINFGGGELAAPLGSNAFVARLSSQGAYVYARSFGDDGAQHAEAITVDSKGNAFVVGNFNGAITFGGAPLKSVGGFDAFVAKLNPTGCPLWGKAFGDAPFQSATGVAVAPGGKAAVTGSIAGAVNFGGGALVAQGDDVFVAQFGP